MAALNRAVGILGGTLVLSLVFFLLNRPSFEGDSLVLIHNGFEMRHCLTEGRWLSCAEAGQFPPFQLLPAFLLGALGFSEHFAAHFFSYLSFALFLSWFWTFKKTLRSPTLFPLACIVLLSGYVIRYANSTFGEVLAATLILAMVASRLQGRPTWITALLLAASVTTKDTALPFAVAYLGFAQLTRPKISLREILAFGFAALTGFATCIALNFFRFGTFYNKTYLNPVWIVTDRSLQFSQFLAIWFSPSAGIAIFWTSAFVVLVASLLFSIRRNSIQRRLDWIAPGVAAVLFLLTLGFSKWAAPFGWYSWGPRLMLPWIPAALLLVLFSQARNFEDAIDRWCKSRPIVFWILAVVLGVSAFPHYRVLIRSQWIDRIIEGSSPNLQWFSRWPIVEMYVPRGRETPEFIGALFLTALLIWVLARYRRDLPHLRDHASLSGRL